MTEQKEIRLRKIIMREVEVGRKIVDGQLTNTSSYLLKDFDKLVEDLIRFIDDENSKQVEDRGALVPS